MIDGSKLPFEDNIALTRRVTDACHPGGIPVEGELGRIAFTKGVKAYMQENPDAFDPKKYSARGMEEVKAYVMQKMEVVGSIGKAAN